MKRYLLLLFIISLIFISVACGNKTNKNDESDIIVETVITGETVEEKASISSIIINNGEISLKIKNLTQDNTLVSAYIEYFCMKEGEEVYSSNLDAERLNISSGSISDKITFNPLKPLNGDEIIFKLQETDY